MIFKVAEGSSTGTSFVESMHVSNISEEAISIIKKTKQHFLPSIYLRVFYDILETMPEEVQHKVQDIIYSYDDNDTKDDIEDLKIIFENLVNLFQHIVSLYKKTQDLQKNIKIVKGYLQSASTKSDIIKITDYLSNTVNQSNIFITSNLLQLKKEYTGIKTYVQSVSDPSVYHKVYTSSYNKVFFTNRLDIDLTTLDVSEEIGLGIFFVRFEPSFLAAYTKKLKSSEKNIEANLMGKALTSSVNQYLRKMDYLGVLDNDLFVVVFKNTRFELLKYVTEDMSSSLSKTKMFNVSDILKIQIGGFFLNNPSILSEDVIDAFEHIFERLKESEKNCVIEDYMEYLAL
jgi:predicted Zn-dependent protease with MMP-like domain